MPSRLLLVLLLALALPVAAETQYVTDQNEFHLRAGESTKFKILRTVQSGTALEILSVNASTGYAKVRTEDGLTGYIMTRYLQAEPSARNQLADMQTRLAELQQAPDQLAARLSNLQAEHAALQEEFRVTQRDKERAQQELAEVRHAAANVVRIDAERKQLQDQVAALLIETDALKQKNLELGNRERQRWFLIGAGVIVGGVLLGLLLPHLRIRRRRSSWGSL